MTGRVLMRAPRLRSVEGTESGRKVTWLELFFDLVFVAAVAQVGTPLAMAYSPEGLLRYASLFVLIWSAWVGHTTFSTRFDTDDGVQRVLTLLQMFAVAVMAINAKDALDSRSSAGFAAAYAAMRVILVVQYARVRHIDASRQLTTRYLIGCGTGAVVWLAAALAPPPARYWLWSVALAIDLVTPLAAEAHSVDAPPDASHLPERFGLFTLILLGESIVAVMHGMESQEGWSVPAATAAFVGIGVGFLLWWWYFDGAGATSDRPTRTRREARLFRVWAYAHLPLFLGIAVTGVGLEHIVRAASFHGLSPGESAILCSALATAMLAMLVISASAPGVLQSSGARARLAGQVFVAGLVGVSGAFGPAVPPHVLVLWLAALTSVQVGLALRASSAGGHVAETGSVPAARAPHDAAKPRVQVLHRSH